MCSYADTRSLLVAIIHVSNRLEEAGGSAIASQILALMIRRLRDSVVPSYLAADCVNRGVLRGALSVVLSVRNECVPSNTVVAKEFLELNDALVAKFPMISNSIALREREEEGEDDVDMMKEIEELQRQRDRLTQMSHDKAKWSSGTERNGGRGDTSEMKHRISMLLERSKAVTKKES